ncbi:MAG: hypothetical protein ACK47B_23290 [Armatimonadota bacterium]
MRKQAVLLALAAALTWVLPAAAWWPKGHGILARAAVRALPRTMPAYFREGGSLVAHVSEDPDVAKNRDAPHVSDQESPEHFFNAELLQGRPLPETRYQFLKLCAEAKLDPKEVGLLPYAVTEWTERLAVAFAEHRRWPDNPHIRTKTLVYAGFLAHYAGDLEMPLHTTIHHDGRVPPGGKSPRSGIHARVDSLPEKLGLNPKELAKGVRPAAAAEVMPFVLRELEASRAQVDRVYALEAQLPPERGDWPPSPEIRAFTRERAAAATRFLASLYLTAWEKSATIRLPEWLDRTETPAATR